MSALGALYLALDELEAEGYIVSRIVPSGPERGNRARRMVTATGKVE